MYFKKPCGVFSLSRDPTHNLAEPTFIQHCLSVSPVMEKWSPLFPQAKCLITERSAEMERKLLNVDERQKESMWRRASYMSDWRKLGPFRHAVFCFMVVQMFGAWNSLCYQSVLWAMPQKQTQAIAIETAHHDNLKPSVVTIYLKMCLLWHEERNGWWRKNEKKKHFFFRKCAKFTAIMLKCSYRILMHCYGCLSFLVSCEVAS